MTILKQKISSRATLHETQNTVRETKIPRVQIVSKKSIIL